MLLLVIATPTTVMALSKAFAAAAPATGFASSSAPRRGDGKRVG